MKYSIHFYFIHFVSVSFLFAQNPFLEIRPFAPPTFQQYPVRQHVDHHYPTSNIEDGVFLRFDGIQFNGDVVYPDCIQGSSCYDGHAGVDYHMPFNTPILASADGYVLWAAFSPPADPCPGGIEPNGDQGTIIIAHGNDYFSCYFHMNPPLTVSVGETVETGDTLGFNGNTGCAIEAHLHFEIRKDSWYFDTDESWAVDPFGWWGTGEDPIKDLRGNRSEWLWVSSDLVDDGDNGFQRYHGTEWTYLDVGYDGDSWTAPAVTDVEESRHYAIWVPWLEESGEYEIQIFIPEGLDAVTSAQYEIIVQDDEGINTKTIVVVNQNSIADEFATIATMELPSGSKSSVILRDIVENSSVGETVIYDAVKFVNTTAGASDDATLPESFTLYPPFPNPFNPFTTIRFSVETLHATSLHIYDITGQVVETLIQEQMEIGTHDIQWTPTNLPTGIYFASLSNGQKTQGQKLIFLK